MSVGNLPPHAAVLIKIVYVAELLVEGENIVFNIPGSVAPWKQDAALEQETQVNECEMVTGNILVNNNRFLLEEHEAVAMYIVQL